MKFSYLHTSFSGNGWAPNPQYASSRMNTVDGSFAARRFFIRSTDKEFPVGLLGDAIMKRRGFFFRMEIISASSKSHVSADSVMWYSANCAPTSFARWL